MSARFLALPFAAEALGPITRSASGRPSRVVVSNGKVSTELDLETGAATAVPGEHRRTRAEPSLALGGLGERMRETDEGPVSELFAPERPDAVLATFSGELIEAARSGPLVLLSVAVPGPRFDVVATSIAPDARELRLPGAYAAALAADGPWGLCVTHDAVHAFRSDGHSLGALSVAIPSAPRLDAEIVGGEAVVLAGPTLLLLALDAMPFEAGRHHAIAVSYAPIVGKARGLRNPGVVVATVGQKILVDHPDVKRITIERTDGDPPVRAGDQVRIDDVREPLPGILRVHAWSRADGTASVRPPPPALELAAPLVSPIAPSVGGPSSPPRPRDAQAMRAIAAAWGFVVPPALDAFLAATDADPVLCRWLTRLGIDAIDLRSLAADWNADPCVISVAGRGNGDAAALYLYPPALARGEEPIVVEFWHETNECSFLARTFAEYLGALLAEHESSEREVVGLVAARLGVAPLRAIAGTPPEWLPSPSEAAPPVAEIEAREARGDRLGAERGWIEHYVAEGPTHLRARAELRRLYEALGWTAALDAMRGVG